MGYRWKVAITLWEPTTHLVLWEPTIHLALWEPITYLELWDPTTHSALWGPITHLALRPYNPFNIVRAYNLLNSVVRPEEAGRSLWYAEPAQCCVNPGWGRSEEGHPHPHPQPPPPPTPSRRPAVCIHVIIYCLSWATLPDTWRVEQGKSGSHMAERSTGPRVEWRGGGPPAHTDPFSLILSVCWSVCLDKLSYLWHR